MVYPSTPSNVKSPYPLRCVVCTNDKWPGSFLISEAGVVGSGYSTKDKMFYKECETHVLNFDHYTKIIIQGYGESLRHSTTCVLRVLCFQGDKKRHPQLRSEQVIHCPSNISVYRLVYEVKYEIIR